MYTCRSCKMRTANFNLAYNIFLYKMIKVLFSFIIANKCVLLKKACHFDETASLSKLSKKYSNKWVSTGLARFTGLRQTRNFNSWFTNKISWLKQLATKLKVYAYLVISIFLWTNHLLFSFVNAFSQLFIYNNFFYD